MSEPLNNVWREGAAWRAYSPDSEDLGHFRFKRDANNATEPSGHTVEVGKFDSGRHPIQGWNWPVWGYRVYCTCGYRSGNVAGQTTETVKAHLEVTRVT